MGAKNLIDNRRAKKLIAQNEALNVPRNPVGFSSCKSVIVLYDANDLENEMAILMFCKSLIEKGKSVKLIGIISEKLKKKKGETESFVTFVDRRIVKEALENNGTSILSLFENNEDILINLCFSANPVIKLILALAPKVFRVSVHAKSLEQYADFMVSMPDNNMDLAIESINHYLSFFNK
jgi:hypothetical protein